IATPALIVLSVIDFRSNRIPDYCSLLLGVVGVWVAFQNNVLFMNLVVAVFLGGLLWAVSEWYFRSYKVEALGLGDVKLMIALTIWLGPQKFSTMLFLASVAGVALLLYQRNKSIPGRSTIVSPSSIQPTVPFGPLLAYSFFLTILTNTP
ncbi:MAG: A24 family peptidase, partial [Roseobacter sp.]